MKNSISAILFLSLLLFAHCDNGNGADVVVPPTNLTITTEVSSDGSGVVNILADAENAKYFNFFFGDITSESPTKRTLGAVSHVYKESGEYTVTVQAHADETIFISDTKTINVEIFISVPATGYSTPDNYVGMNLVFADEFAGTSVNLDKWTFENGDGCPNVCGWGNNELEYYQPENSVLVDGSLVIEAKAEVVGSKSYSSSKLITKNNFNFKYGRIDVRAALPEGQGLWPAIWMLGSNISTVGWPACGEIDIMEMIGGNNRENTVHGTVHWDNAGFYASYGNDFSLSSGIFKDEFHVFTIIWDAEKIQWFVDDVQFNVIDTRPSGLSEFREDFYLLLNVAVGGNWPGNPDNNTSFPQRMFVDYVRVFQNQ